MKPPSTILFTNGNLILPDRELRQGSVLCRNGRIVALGKRMRAPRGAEVVDAHGGYISPGFVELHVHGGDGSDYMSGTSHAVRTANRCHARHGTTTIHPTTTVASRARIAAMLNACAEVRRTWMVSDGARLQAVHFYGPYFAKGWEGAHPKADRRDPDRREYTKALASGIVGVATCAAELPGAETFYRAARRHGCLVTCGHSNASWTEMDRAFRAGMRHVDHFWCAMSSIPSLITRLGTPMRGSMAEYVLANPEMSTEVIADGYHLAPELLTYAWRVKGCKRLCLVTDSNCALDMPPGKYRIGHHKDGEPCWSDGRVGMEKTGMLASSVQGMDHMVRTMWRNTGAPLHEVIRMASLTPAERTGIARHVGSLERGKHADVLVLDRALKVKGVWMDGERFR